MATPFLSIKAPKECSKKVAATSKTGNPLPEEMFFECSFVLRRFWGASTIAAKIITKNFLKIIFRGN